jgi:hypothetical protein
MRPTLIPPRLSSIALVLCIHLRGGLFVHKMNDGVYSL